jgi:hypothetical protein
MKTLFLLLAAHAFADYVFQSDFMAKGKNRRTKPFNVPPGQTPQAIWPYVLTSHALVHGALVYFATGNLYLGLAETACHWLIDFGKCENWYGIHVDQIAHIACKLAWWGLA